MAVLLPNLQVSKLSSFDIPTFLLAKVHLCCPGSHWAALLGLIFPGSYMSAVCTAQLSSASVLVDSLPPSSLGPRILKLPPLSTLPSHWLSTSLPIRINCGRVLPSYIQGTIISIGIKNSYNYFYMICLKTISPK